MATDDPIASARPSPLSGRVLGVVIAGGRARRFGSDKALALLDGVRLIDRVIAALATQSDALAVSGREHGGHDMLEDRPASGLGPLAGNAAALHAARQRGFDFVLTAPCDVPTLPADLRSLFGDGARGAYLAECPVIGIWPSDLSPVIDAYLREQSDRSIRSWGRSVGARIYELGAPLPNINTEQDLAQERSRPA